MVDLQLSTTSEDLIGCQGEISAGRVACCDGRFDSPEPLCQHWRHDKPHVLAQLPRRNLSVSTTGQDVHCDLVASLPTRIAEANFPILKGYLATTPSFAVSKPPALAHAASSVHLGSGCRCKTPPPPPPPLLVNRWIKASSEQGPSVAWCPSWVSRCSNVCKHPCTLWAS